MAGPLVGRVLIIVLLILFFAQAPEEQGIMQRYGPGVMEEVVANRIRFGMVPEWTDPYMAVALVDCGRIGDTIWIEWPDGAVTGPHTVADCSAKNDRQRHLDKGLVVEVSYPFAVDRSVPYAGYRLPLDGPLPGVTVRSERPPYRMREYEPN